MNNAEQPAFPDPLRGGEPSIVNQNPDKEPLGLTKREYFAGLALQGIITNGSRYNDFAKTAVELADKLLAELDK